MARRMGKARHPTTAETSRIKRIFSLRPMLCLMVFLHGAETSAALLVGL